METEVTNYPVPDGLYQHFKGGVYSCLTMAVHSETQEPMVVYVSELFGTVFVRPLAEWNKPLPDGGVRFALIEEDFDLKVNFTDDRS